MIGVNEEDIYATISARDEIADKLKRDPTRIKS